MNDLETKCTYQLTDWVNDIADVQFAIDQLRKYGGRLYFIKSFRASVAVFTEPPSNWLDYFPPGAKNEHV